MRFRFGCLIVVAVLLIACGGLWVWSRQGSTEIVTETLISSVEPCGKWEAVSGPGFGSWDSELHVVGGAASDDVWALGYRAHTTPPLPFGGPLSPFSLSGEPYSAHWDGKLWDVRALEIQGNTPSGRMHLTDMAVISANDIWAVGYTFAGRSFIFALHWDGKSWSAVPTPNEGNQGSHLSSIAASAPNDIWAVGYYDSAPCCPNSTQPLVMHWDGQTWSLDRSLAADLMTGTSTKSDGHLLLGVAATSTDSVWAVGYRRGSMNQNGIDPTQPFAVHWDGSRWNSVPMPSTPYNSYPTDIAAISENDAWAVGVMGLTMHWDGKVWSRVENPLMDVVAQHLNSVVAVARDDVWTLGADAYSGYANGLHWNGTEWMSVSTPEVYPHQGFYHAAYVPPNEIWGAGGTLSGLEEPAWYSLAARFTGTPSCLGRN